MTLVHLRSGPLPSLCDTTPDTEQSNHTRRIQTSYLVTHYIRHRGGTSVHFLTLQASVRAVSRYRGCEYELFAAPHFLNPTQINNFNRSLFFEAILNLRILIHDLPLFWDERMLRTC